MKPEPRSAKAWDATGTAQGRRAGSGGAVTKKRKAAISASARRLKDYCLRRPRIRIKAPERSARALAPDAGSISGEITAAEAMPATPRVKSRAADRILMFRFLG